MDLALLSEFATHPNEMIGLMILRAKLVTTDSDVPGAGTGVAVWKVLESPDKP
jgi:hypothetical protein